jgi:hypothetical protein
MSNSLWPDFNAMPPPRGMREMLYDAAGDLDARTNGLLEFYVDTLGVADATRQVRHNCYLGVKKTGYNHLLFRVTTPATGPWPATLVTPEGDSHADIQDEPALRHAIQQVLQRERTKEIVLYLMSTVR